MTTTDARVAAPLIADLLRKGLEAGSRPQLTIVSGSMQPLLAVGDQVTLQSCPVDRLQPGDIIVLAGDDDLFTHRLRCHQFTAAGHFLITRGDRTLAYDLPWPAERFVGRVATRQRRGRTLSLCDGHGRRLQSHFTFLAATEEQLFGDKHALAHLHESSSARLLGNRWRRARRRPLFIATRSLLLLWRTFLVQFFRGERQN